MRELNRASNQERANIDSVLEGCVLENGMLVPAPNAQYDEELQNTNENDWPGIADVVIDGETVPNTPPSKERASRLFNGRSLGRVAVISAMVFLPVQSADAFISNRAFYEVNIMADAVNGINKAEIIGNNITKTVNDIKTTTDNIVKLANGGSK